MPECQELKTSFFLSSVTEVMPGCSYSSLSLSLILELQNVEPCVVKQISPGVARIHLNGGVVAEWKASSISSIKEGRAADLGPVVLSGGDGSTDGDSVQGYAHYVRVLPQPTVTNHYVKVDNLLCYFTVSLNTRLMDVGLHALILQVTVWLICWPFLVCQNPPLELSLDGSTGASEDHEVEEGGDGVWSVVGGKVGIFFFFPLSSYFSQNHNSSFFSCEISGVERVKLYCSSCNCRIFMPTNPRNHTVHCRPLVVVTLPLMWHSWMP
jgi:hypothetical protein